jgi:hypothetical protein
MAAAGETRIDRLTFVYDADGTVVGELRYWFGTLLGAPHCTLCDVTHSRWRRKPSFRACADRVGLSIEYLHRDDLDDGLRSLAGPLPVVIGHSGRDQVRLLGPEDLRDLHGDVVSFEAILRSAIAKAEPASG